MPLRTLTLGHSPDPDDAYMFYALARDRIPTGPYRFEHVHQDIQTLNQRALAGELDITAMSVHAYAHASGRYALLPHGASMGDGYGPMLVAREPLGREELANSLIAIPGVLTSAFLALQMWLGRKAREIRHRVVPFDRIPEAVREGEADAGLIIHEGQLTYAREGLALCQDLGRWWQEENGGLPLPLGANAIHKRFGEGERRDIAAILGESIRYAMDHHEPALEYAMEFGRGIDRELAGRFVGMYVNHWTLDYGPRGRQAIAGFLHRAHREGLLDHRQEPEFVG